MPGLGAMLPYGAVAAMDYAVAAGSFHPRQSPVNPAFTHSWYVLILFDVVNKTLGQLSIVNVIC